MSAIRIRPYTARDRDAVLRLAADTAFFGEPLERYLDDRQLFCDAMYAYYTDLEPEHAWVACADTEVVGFVVGCIDSSVRRRRWLARILPRLAYGVLRGKYTIGARTWRHSARMMKAAIAPRPKIDERRYPAHLHLNVHAAWRSQGIGRQLLAASLDQLRALRVRGVHLKTTSLNTSAVRLYERAGFRMADSRPTSQWIGLVPDSVTNVAYVR
ncbi:MAG TPA: GNAT family N-acetyltransferase, partial [Steroidobacteraceae bacterium]|nr:GNAT family N-acetyltransferase [Steroidobacteraceae bacterium]